MSRRADPVLSLEHVSKGYRHGSRQIEALHDVSLELGPGEFVAVHGGMRAGKTTLLRIVAGIERPDSGMVRFRGVDLAEMSERQLAHYRRSMVGTVGFDDVSAHHLSVRDYIALPLFAEREPFRAAHLRAYRALERVGVDVSGEEPIAGLSDGERLRVGLAHALVREPALLLADEPVWAADANYVEGAEILSLLRAIARDMGCAVLITAAQAPGATRTTRIIGLDRGRVTARREKPGGEIVAFPMARGDHRQTS